ncbi:IucA/IucC family siderophore biosynthesis protein [Pseudovibrio exalbescens]|uniref:IucA/IucC family protein n=1 Tax=Pseudovibrio exalbescens TaxID=197461 RepID=UPI002365DDEF|nr:IucA/IucC family siderophore biosynthesis protein [Pseudovibrio exalbescens]MDD7912004.1 IucA/IucC family siderophore biosynthesis protein [Pseudovibrio exalbescens]
MKPEHVAMTANRTAKLSASARFAPSPANWDTVCRDALAKMISELTYEEVLAPIELGGGQFVLEFAGAVEYRFRAKTMAWGNLWVFPETISRTPAQEDCVSPLQFTIDARAELGMRPETLATFLRELSNTLAQDLTLAQKQAGLTRDALLALPSYRLDALLEGHPKAVANKGRLGWGAEDVSAYAPEAGKPFEPVWLAARRDGCVIGSEKGDDETSFLARTLGPETYGRLMACMENTGCTLKTHCLIPAHPWQWENVLRQAYISDLAKGDLVCLGAFGGHYVAGPSLRTLTSIDRPGSPDLKLSLSILNTSAWRGIPGKYIPHGPALSDWLEAIVCGDELTRETVTILRERAGIWYRHPLYDQIPDAPYQHHETLGAIWRDNPAARIKPGQKAHLYASLLHKDPEGRPLAAGHADKAGLSFEEWLEQLFDVTVRPLYHLLCKYGVAFIAHGQNLTVVLEDHVPVGVALKDLQGDVFLVDQVFPEQAGLDESLRQVVSHKPPSHIIHNLQTGHFVTVLRFLSARLAMSGILDERRFYEILKSCLARYMDHNPDLRSRFAMFDLMQPTVPRLCINKVRFEVGYADNPDRPSPGLGTDLINPLHDPKQL